MSLFMNCFSAVLCMYDIIDNCNRIGRNLGEEKYYKEFKTALKSLQKKCLKCDKVNLPQSIKKIPVGYT